MGRRVDLLQISFQRMEEKFPNSHAQAYIWRLELPQEDLCDWKMEGRIQSVVDDVLLQRMRFWCLLKDPCNL